MDAAITQTLSQVLSEANPTNVSILLDVEPGGEDSVRDRLDDMGVEYREAHVGRISIIETRVKSAEIQSVASIEGVTRIDHNPTFSTQGVAEVGFTAEASANVNRIDTKIVGSRLSIEDAWKEAGSKGAGVKIGMVDTGIDTKHPAIVHAIADSTEQQSTETHGTWVAGAMVAKETSVEGRSATIRGVAPEAELYASGALGSGKADFVDVANGMDWCLNNGVDILNMSVGGPHSDLMHDAVREIVREDVTVITSCGNSGPAPGTVSCPAHHREAIAVASVNGAYQPARFSSRGPGWIDAPRKPDISCYGGHTDANGEVSESILSTAANGTYSYLIGTSMACPFVSGVRAIQIADPAGGGGGDDGDGNGDNGGDT